jgi:hypothetical protein
MRMWYVQCTTHFVGVFQNYVCPLQELVEEVQFVPGVGEVILVLYPTDFGPLPLKFSVVF